MTVDEFVNAYQKNNSFNESTEKDLREYLDLYINYRMKVQEAKALQLDTAKAFQKEWEAKKTELAEKFGITSWREINTIGTESYEGVGAEARKTGVKGGLKILFSNREGKDIAFIWMRGSGTEPVFRILADIESSNPDDERYLINWQHHLVEEADKAAK